MQLNLPAVCDFSIRTQIRSIAVTMTINSGIEAMTVSVAMPVRREKHVLTEWNCRMIVIISMIKSTLRFLVSYIVYFKYIFLQNQITSYDQTYRRPVSLKIILVHRLVAHINCNFNLTFLRRFLYSKIIIIRKSNRFLSYAFLYNKSHLISQMQNLAIKPKMLLNL